MFVIPLTPDSKALTFICLHSITHSELAKEQDCPTIKSSSRSQNWSAATPGFIVTLSLVILYNLISQVFYLFSVSRDYQFEFYKF
jgi:hypothetical protein